MSPRSADFNANRLEDLLWFVETGESLEGAAARLGVVPNSLAKWCERRGRWDIVVTLRARNPSDPTKSPSELGKIGAHARWTA